MRALLRQPKRLFIAVLALLLTLSLGAMTQAQSKPDLARLALENRLAELLVDLNLTPSQLEEARSVVVALKEAREAQASAAASLLEERKAAILGGDLERKKEIDKELREVLSGTLTQIPEAKAFLEGLTERQRGVLRHLLGEPIAALRRDEAPRAPRPVIVERFMFSGPGRMLPFFEEFIHPAAERPGEDRLEVLIELIEEMLR